MTFSLHLRREANANAYQQQAPLPLPPPPRCADTPRLIPTNCHNRTGAKTDNLEKHDISNPPLLLPDSRDDSGGHRASPRVFIRVGIIHLGTVGSAKRPRRYAGESAGEER